MQEFISASTYAMEKINFAEKSALLEEILNTKGKLLLDFQTRSVVDFEHLRWKIEANYLGKRGTRLQLEFNALKQKSGESAHTYGLCVDILVMELYKSLIKKTQSRSEHSENNQALLNFELGLREDIKLVYDHKIFKPAKSYQCKRRRMHKKGLLTSK